MNTSIPAGQVLQNGDLQLALKQLQEQVRSRPGDAKLRVFLFQLLCVLGCWDRALNQLNVCGEMDASALAMVQTYREAIQCERLREQVFSGRKAPLLFGEPEPWVALLIEALLRDGHGERGAARCLREQAFEQAPVNPGTADSHAFEWLADADMRLGPVLEAIVNGRYYWIPMQRLNTVTIDPPADLRDRVWMPAQLQFSNGGEVVALLPTRYPGTTLDDPQLAAARRTDWIESLPGFHVGSGQRMFTTNDSDLPLMDVRSLSFVAG